MEKEPTKRQETRDILRALATKFPNMQDGDTFGTALLGAQIRDIVGFGQGEEIREQIVAATSFEEFKQWIAQRKCYYRSIFRVRRRAGAIASWDSHYQYQVPPASIPTVSFVEQ
eukprot:TRINITY_DN25995_c0_g1_i1.p2 TRINITY_DN25995_c0_g1~~TRINITY_DN25995_c0_g1_i1.p2  ORF type:complete len:114 (+),score=19.61 TRINITY_DN25995_c0_g1_i1:32-373(+)